MFWPLACCCRYLKRCLHGDWLKEKTSSFICRVVTWLTTKGMYQFQNRVTLLRHTNAIVTSSTARIRTCGSYSMCFMFSCVVYGKLFCESTHNIHLASSGLRVKIAPPISTHCNFLCHHCPDSFQDNINDVPPLTFSSSVSFYISCWLLGGGDSNFPYNCEWPRHPSQQVQQADIFHLLVGTHCTVLWHLCIMDRHCNAK